MRTLRWRGVVAAALNGMDRGSTTVATRRWHTQLADATLTSMKPADRFRVIELLHAIATEGAHISVHAGEVVLSPACGAVGSRYAQALCRELIELHEQHPSEVGELLAARRAA